MTTREAKKRQTVRLVGTQRHKAKVDPKGFGRVFWRAQAYLDEITRLATKAEEKAPALLPQEHRTLIDPVSGSADRR